MRGSVVAGVLSAGFLAGSALAQDAVQWRVEDGGNGHWYSVQNDGGTWLQAKESAELTGAHLATVANAQENTFLWGLLGASGFYPCFAFLGGYQDSDVTGFVEPGGGWRWVTGEPFEFSAWFSGEPNDGFGCGGCENFLSFRQFDCNARWNDTGLNAAPNHTFIVEYSADCNSDGIVDYGQIRAGELEDTNANNIPDCCEQGVACDCPADIDESGTVDAIDLAIVIGFWGTDGGKQYPQADIDGSGEIDGADLAALLGSWGACE